MNSANSRLPYIDVAKGLGILLVICSHVYPPLMSWASPCFVPIFYVLSGFTTTHVVSIKSKFTRLIIPYLLFSVLLVVGHRHFTLTSLTGIAYSRYCLYPLSTEDNIIFLDSCNQPLWFLTSMFLSFVLLSIAQRVGRLWFVVPFFLLLTFCLTFLPILLPWSIDTVFLTALFIMAGIELRRRNIMGKMNVEHKFGITFVYAILTYFCGTVNLSVRDYGTSLFLYLPAALLGSVMLMIISEYMSRVGIFVVIQKLGQHSLPIFCIHVAFINVWDKILQELPIMPDAIRGLLMVLCITATTYPLAVVFDLYITKRIRV